MKTEAEAKLLWCPYARTAAWEQLSPVSESAASFNRPWSGNDDGGDAQMLANRDCRCLASACMMWEWVMDEMAGDPEEGKGTCGLKR